ncbi:hypothetical protein BDZ91DRAFT_723071 [Kalaharituber pfeilii]|nr:hypothetical protein BDZ91DRAFT_723071 [Kalaharituber pfeilii]
MEFNPTPSHLSRIRIVDVCFPQPLPLFLRALLLVLLLILTAFSTSCLHLFFDYTPILQIILLLGIYNHSCLLLFLTLLLSSNSILVILILTLSFRSLVLPWHFVLLLTIYHLPFLSFILSTFLQLTICSRSRRRRKLDICSIHVRFAITSTITLLRL